MVSRLAHRGPDAEGVVSRGHAVLGSRRLAVIDVGEGNNQPLSDRSGRFWISYNGEIYNFAEVRAELASLGAEFATQGDTEVILEAYKRWGVEAVHRLNGMFAFALWDEVEERLFLARDRAGEKPLFYQRLPGSGLIFASELQALRAHPAASRAVNPEAIGQFLSLNYLLTDTSILAGVERLPAGCFLLVERDRSPRKTRYWDLAASFREKRRFESEAAAAEELNALIDDSVRLRLVSDVPLGAFLSGGIDSSTVVESMTRLQPADRTETFTIGFPEPTFSELDEATQVARFLNVSGNGRMVTGEMSIPLPEIIRSAGEPFADTSMVPLWFVSKLAREKVTVCLSGDGGDEILAGYETYQADRYHHTLSRLPSFAWRPIERWVDRLWPVRFDKVSFDYKLRRFLQGLQLDGRRAHHHWRKIFSDEEKRALFKDRHRELAESDGFDIIDRHFEEISDCHFLDQAMYVDIKTWLVDDILVKVDRATMAHSLESRAPYLDHRLMEFAASLPVSLKLKGLRRKHLLRRARRDRLPRQVIAQKKKGFNAPVGHWLRGPLRDASRRLTTGEPVSEWLEPAAVETLWQEHLDGRRDHGLKLFGLTCLGLWMSEA